MNKTHDGRHGPECFGCRIQDKGIQFAPSATPSRMNDRPPRSADPAWERGIAGEHRRDGSFMPFIHESTMNPIHLKEWSENGHRYTEALRGS